MARTTEKSPTKSATPFPERATHPPPAEPSTNGRRFKNFSEISSFIWDVFELLRGDYRRSEYGMVVLPFTLLRRLDCVLDGTKAKVLKRKGGQTKNIDPFLTRITGVQFYNTSKFTVPRLLDDPNNIAQNLTSYIKAFPEGIREVFIQRYKFNEQIAKLDEANLLYQVVDRFAHGDLHPKVVANTVMGSIFEELIRRSAEAANEEAGELLHAARSHPVDGQPAVHGRRERPDEAGYRAHALRPRGGYRRYVVCRGGKLDISAPEEAVA